MLPQKLAKHGLLIITLALSTIFSIQVQSQTTQSIRGRVVDRDSKVPLISVNVLVTSVDNAQLGASTDGLGYFEIENVPIGRHTLTFSYLGYEDFTLPNQIISSGKELEVKAEMVEVSNIMNEVKVGSKKPQASNNEMISVSGRSFDAEEAERYPGSRQDPARMAQNFAGVAGTDDQRNDIVIRGNSPLGLLWRFEGVDIFNPSHFAVAGSTGGPISMLNNKVIGKSDFMTSAFPSEYGNGISGVFDLKMRNGNYNKQEFSGQFGLFGTELSAEGPINKEKKSSYIIAYRYATFAIFQQIGIDIGTDAVPNYQDLNFKLNFPTKKGGLSIFGVGGLSSIDIVFSDDSIPTRELYGQKDRDQYFRTNMGVIGVNYRHFLNNTTRFNIVLAHNAQQVRSTHNKIIRDPNEYTRYELLPVSRSKMFNNKSTLNADINKKFSARSVLKVGVIADLYHLNYDDSLRSEVFPYDWTILLNNTSQDAMARTYASWKYKWFSDLTVNAGLHFLYFTRGQQTAIEPRLSFNWQKSGSESISFGYGMHSQAQPLYVYYSNFTDSTTKTLGRHNMDIGLSRSHHFVLSYEKMINPHLRFRAETYYQQLYNVPVEQLSSSFSLINQGSGFTRFFPDALTNTGTGNNMGIEATIERYFNKNYYVMATGSIYDSKYKGSDGVLRNSDFNGNFIFNILGGYEHAFGQNKKNVLSFGTKFTMGGGKRFSPIDSIATQRDGAQVIIVNSERNTLQFRDYYRWDLKLGIKFNAKNSTHEISIDLANALDTKNILTMGYFEDPENPGNKIYREEYQLGRLPNFWYRIDF
ncbi:MAG: hypothetical protein ACI8ZN_000012 [Bacteroidia bacterium]|jgi:hypothetical protein